MTLDKSYLLYPERHYGMDHQRYDWSMLQKRSPIQWPKDKKVALWINVGMQFFPLNQHNEPIKVPGGMTMPYPDLRHYTLRDYGNRVGIYRFLEAFEKYNIKASFAFNAKLAEKLPQLVDRILQTNSSLLCHGYQMDALHFGGMDQAQEREIIEKSLRILSTVSQQKIRGWLSPAKMQSENTLDLLAELGIDYCCDWVNDDMPYYFKTRSKALAAMPLSTELSDHFILMNNLHSEPSYVQQIKDAFDLLLAESESQGGRILALQIHPWLLGHAHRIKYLEEVLEYLSSHPQCWSASANEIFDCWQQQVDAPTE